MKKLLLAVLLIGMTSFLFLGPVYAADVKIGVIDTQKIMILHFDFMSGVCNVFHVMRYCTNGAIMKVEPQEPVSTMLRIIFCI